MDCFPHEVGAVLKYMGCYLGVARLVEDQVLHQLSDLLELLVFWLLELLKLEPG